MNPKDQRADALHNRAAILAAAHDLLLHHETVSMNAIAKKAGVGPGTLYRHFATREELILELYCHDVQHHADTVDHLLEEMEPLAALRVWIEQLAIYTRMKHGLGEALTKAAEKSVVQRTYPIVIQALSSLLKAASDAEQIQPNILPDDVLLLVSALWRVPQDQAGLKQAERLLDIILCGLR
ncbi:TetR family transcriptional regulator [Reticulibacter mediterranei]|uniref:TetR family transcriptional regulator n=1 Tax=Reticulibacter mediterranei TaxID=2778369 RepID=A0A8J3N6P6_9CHLR|nr:TetR/AcrR family transcriptional regulator [Reticulibacter mediterranei]GHO97645.1 TetR family transcriptional regulator [Reticulibacter mediterranei]